MITEMVLWIAGLAIALPLVILIGAFIVAFIMTVMQSIRNE